MKIAELRQLTTKKLFAALREKRRELAVTRFQIKTGQVIETSKVGLLRKTIARILTLLNQKEA